MAVFRVLHSFLLHVACFMDLIFFATHSATCDKKNVVFDFLLLHLSDAAFLEFSFATCDVAYTDTKCYTRNVFAT